MTALEEVLERVRTLGGDDILRTALGFDAGTVARINGGARGISFTELKLVAAAAGVSAHWLLTGERDPNEVVVMGRSSVA